MQQAEVRVEAARLILTQREAEHVQARERLARYAAGIANEETRRGALGSVVDVWAEQDPDAAMAWAANAGPEAQQMVMLKATMAKAGDDPAASAAILAKLAGGGGEKDEDALQAAGSVRKTVKQCIEKTAKLPALGCP